MINLIDELLYLALLIFVTIISIKVAFWVLLFLLAIFITP